MYLSVNGALLFLAFFIYYYCTIEEEDEENRSLFVNGDSQGEAVFVAIGVLLLPTTAAVENSRFPSDLPVSGGLNLSSGIGRLQTS